MENTGTDPRANGPAASVDPMATIATAPDSEARLRALLERKGTGIRVRLDASPDFDVTGHTATAASVTLTVLDGDDDTEGHAISLRFPNAEEAKRFQQRMIATGALAATLVIAGTGLALTQGGQQDAGAAGGTQAQVVSSAGSQAWADPGYAANVDAATGAVTSGGQAAADVGYASEAQTPTPGSQAWADQGPGGPSAATGDVTSGGQAAADPGYGSDPAEPNEVEQRGVHPR